MIYILIQGVSRSLPLSIEIVTAPPHLRRHNNKLKLANHPHNTMPSTNLGHSMTKVELCHDMSKNQLVFGGFYIRRQQHIEHKFPISTSWATKCPGNLPGYLHIWKVKGQESCIGCLVVRCTINNFKLISPVPTTVSMVVIWTHLRQIYHQTSSQ